MFIFFLIFFLLFFLFINCLVHCLVHRLVHHLVHCPVHRLAHSLVHYLVHHPVLTIVNHAHLSTCCPYEPPGKAIPGADSNLKSDIAKALAEFEDVTKTEVRIIQYMYTCTPVHLYTCTPIHLHTCTPAHSYQRGRLPGPRCRKKLH